MDLQTFVAWLVALHRDPPRDPAAPDFEDTLVAVYAHAPGDADDADRFPALQQA